MISTKNLVLSPSDIPSYWVFQYYLNLSERLTGQDIKIKSIFNPLEKTPSFCIYVDKKIMQYKFKDFSTGKSGNKIDLVKMMFDLDFVNASQKITNDYNLHVKSNGFEAQSITVQPKWEVQFIKDTEWTKADASFWLKFNIGKTMLNKYNVKPIKYYSLVKEENLKVKDLKIEGKHIYGYYNKDGSVYKIYQPFSKHKFHKVSKYLQGYDQLQYNQPYLVICSSLKDVMCLASIGYNIETIAPDSENTMIKPHIIEYFKKKYKKVITFFDNDEAGVNAVDKYKTMYNLDGFVLPICKDISDAVKKHGVNHVHSKLKPLLKQTLNK
tara:strand:- start:8968 stop:9942 length:975 start_codon:yes stop_codon:yes gene_type:complete